MLRRQRVFSALGVLLVAMGSLVAGSAASATTTSTFFYVPLTADLQIWGSVTIPRELTTVLVYDLTLQAGESRRVTDQLELTLSANLVAEVDNILVCSLQVSNDVWQQVGDTSQSGTNHQGKDAGSVVLSNSLLLHADVAGTYRCEIRGYAGGGRTDYYAAAVKSGMPATTAGTWMKISAADEVGSHLWESPLCASNGALDDGTDDPGCHYLGASGDPGAVYIFQTPDVPPDPWMAASDATNVDVIGTIQVTSCQHGTGSCTSKHWGDTGPFGTDWGKPQWAVVDSWMGFDQMYPDGTVCRLHQSYDPDTNNRYSIANAVHHFPIRYHLSAPVSPNCGGSRVFVLRVYVRWNDGNPVKVDGGGVFVAINSVRASTTTVPNVVGASQAQATAALNAQGLTASVVSSVVDTAPPGTVIAQNSPGGTVEPVGSPVYLTMSLGGATVPYLLGVRRNDAIAALQAVGLVANPAGNVPIDDPDLSGKVVIQSVAGGSFVAPGTTVTLTFGYYSSHGCGPDPC
jgi:hypothetical protein